MSNPVDQEDRSGQPFVGPAGRVLDKALEDAGIERDRTYVTNAVKHFKFVPAERGQRRLHKQPNHTEIVAWRPWLIAELQAIGPEVFVCLGATAAKAIFRPSFRISKQRGQRLDWPDEPSIGTSGPAVVATIHPSVVLRAPDREAMYDGLVADLRVVSDALA